MARPIVSTLMQTMDLYSALPEGPFDGVILTSEAGAAAAGRLVKKAITLPKRAYCVGVRTAEVACSHGFDATADGATAAELMQVLTRGRTPGRLLYLHGRDVSVQLDHLLIRAGIPAAAAVIYAQDPHPLTEEAIAVLSRSGPVIVPLYSARSARLFMAALTPEMHAQIHPCVIAKPALLALSEPLLARAVVADHPDGAAMLASIRRAIRALLP